MLKCIADTNRPAYLYMKWAAYVRHEFVKNKIENDRRPLNQTWHQAMLDLFYPV